MGTVWPCLNLLARTRAPRKKIQVWQTQVLANTRYVARLGSSTTFEDAAGCIANLVTVIAAFTVVMEMGRMCHAQQPSTGKKILIYGGSSAVGGLAVQVAAHFGAIVVTTSSLKNWTEVEKRTPSRIIDHNQNPKTLLAQLQLQGPYDYIFDTIGGPTVTDVLAKLLASQGGGTIYSTFVTKDVYELPEGVQRKAYSCPSMLQDDEELNAWFFAMFGPTIEDGTIIPTKMEKVPSGFYALQECLDAVAEGKTRGVKLVVDPWEELE